jgi:hypothetical protein
LQRVPAAYIAKGLGGWNFRIITFENGKVGALLLFTFTKNRVNGHLAVAIKDPANGKWKFVHASQRLGFIEVDMVFSGEDPFYPHVSQVKQVQE